MIALHAIIMLSAKGLILDLDARVHRELTLMLRFGKARIIGLLLRSVLLSDAFEKPYKRDIRVLSLFHNRGHHLPDHYCFQMGDFVTDGSTFQPGVLTRRARGRNSILTAGFVIWYISYENERVTMCSGLFFCRLKTGRNYSL